VTTLRGSGPRPDNHVIVVFGATGDLAKRKLLPGLFHLAAAGLMPDRYRIIGSAPPGSALSDEAFRKHAKDAAAEFGTTKPTGAAWDEFEKNLAFGASSTGDFGPLVAAVERAEREIGGSPCRLFHLAIPPVAFESIVVGIGSSGLANDSSRVIIEKPFGNDLRTAKKLNAMVHSVFDESRVFRIDHFLGKESVDNILAFRFSNGLFEPVWNRQYIRYVQIDVPETLSIDDRAAFYDETGAYRDMVVTHLFQVLGFVAMEPPTSLAAEQLRNEKDKVFYSMRHIDTRHVVRGQYEGYRSVPGVAPDSDTETLVAVRAEVDNWRWVGVPFFLRSGKRMGASRQVITLGFHEPPVHILRAKRADTPDGRVNEVVIDFEDPGSISIEFLAKVPGPEMCLGNANMVFRYETSFNEANALEGYERLILLAMIGDQALFTSADGIERAWEVSMPLLENPPPVQPYAPGSWGPAAVDKLVAPYRWHLPGHEH
jgi:glucose-6-phosphate 1-dehydrogenase